MRASSQLRRHRVHQPAQIYCKRQRSGEFRSWVAQKAQGVVKGVLEGITKASFERRAPLTPSLERASARRREQKDFRGVYKIQQVAALPGL